MADSHVYDAIRYGFTLDRPPGVTASAVYELFNNTKENNMATLWSTDYDKSIRLEKVANGYILLFDNKKYVFTKLAQVFKFIEKLDKEEDE